MMQIGGINPIKQFQQTASISPIQPISAKKQEDLREQAAQTQPMFTAPMYTYPMQPMYAMPQQMVYGPQTMPQPFVNNQITQTEPEKITMGEALKAQALQPKIKLEQPTAIEKKAEDKKADEPEIGAVKDDTKPEDVILKAEQQKNIDPQVAAQVKKPEIIAPEKLKPQIDLDGLIDILKSDNFEEQANGMEAISQIAKLAPEKADELLDVKIVDALIGIMSQDTSKVPEADRALAQRNKEYSMYTTAILQKVYADGVKKAVNTEIPMEEVVGMAGIVNELKNNKNPRTREAALTSLSYVKRPEYKEELKHLFSEASNDIDPTVRNTATKELNKIA